jgi:hypothetical protein
MKNIFALAVVLMTLLGAQAKDPVAGVVAGYGEVVFVRQESEGSLNVLQSSITCDMWERLVLVGGQAGSIYLPPGNYEFQAYSREPYEPDSDITSCRSAALRVRVRKGARIFVEIIPQSANKKLSFHWKLKQRKG